jgi:plasmid stabilization system protein ParE
MKYHVELTDTACDNAEEAYQWLKERSSSAATKWFNGLLDVVESLEMFPTRCGIARESEKAGETIRQMLYGKRPHVYRILFIIRDDVVYVLHIRHGARRAMKPEEIRLPPRSK